MALLISQTVVPYGARIFKDRANCKSKQESPAIADKPARRESLPIRRAYNVVADNTGLSSFV